MFEWLEKELSAIKTPRFHVVDGPPDSKLREAVMQSSLLLPASYREFVLRFGNARLYRRSRNGYLIGVFAGPREQKFNDGTRAYQIGFHDDASVYIEPVAGSVVEIVLDSRKVVADDFEEWLAACCTAARSEYGVEKWAEILRGPEPFTPEEEAVIETRRGIHWRVVGIDNEGNHVLEVTNGSSGTLPVLTVGVRSRDRRLNGAVLLRIGDIEPGQTAMLHVDCYRKVKPPEEIEVFELPEPAPEDREFYAELG